MSSDAAEPTGRARPRRRSARTCFASAASTARSRSARDVERDDGELRRARRAQRRGRADHERDHRIRRRAVQQHADVERAGRGRARAARRRPARAARRAASTRERSSVVAVAHVVEPGIGDRRRPAARCVSVVSGSAPCGDRPRRSARRLRRPVAPSSNASTTPVSSPSSAPIVTCGVGVGAASRPRRRRCLELVERPVSDRLGRDVGVALGGRADRASPRVLGERLGLRASARAAGRRRGRGRASRRLDGGDHAIAGLAAQPLDLEPRALELASLRHLLGLARRAPTFAASSSIARRSSSRARCRARRAPIELGLARGELGAAALEVPRGSRARLERLLRALLEVARAARSRRTRRRSPSRRRAPARRRRAGARARAIRSSSSRWRCASPSTSTSTSAAGS